VRPLTSLGSGRGLAPHSVLFPDDERPAVGTAWAPLAAHPTKEVTDG